MKKILTLSIFMLLLVGVMFAQTPTRVVQQYLDIEEGELLDFVTNTGNTHSEHYHMRVLHVESGELRGTDLGTNPAAMKIAKVGSEAAGWSVRAIFNQSQWPAVWATGEHLTIMVWYTGDTTNPTGVEPYAHLEYAEITHEVPSGGGVVAYGLDDPFIIPPFAGGGPEPELFTISGAFTTEHWDFTDLAINVDPAIDGEIAFDAITGLYSFEVPQGWSGMVFPMKDGYIITPANREYQDVAADFENQDYTITKFVDPNAPVITYPEAGTVFEWDEPESVLFTWDAPEGFAPEYYEIKLNDGEWIEVVTAAAWQSDLLGEGEYTFQVRGVINNARSRSTVPVKAQLSSIYSNQATRGAGEAAMVEFEVIIIEDIPTYILNVYSEPAGAAIYLDDEPTGQVTPGEFEVPGTYTVVLEGYTFEPTQFVWEGESDHDITFIGTLIEGEWDIPEDGTPVEIAEDIEISSDTNMNIVDPSSPEGSAIANNAVLLLPNLDNLEDCIVTVLEGSGLATFTVTLDQPGTWYAVLVVGTQVYLPDFYPIIVPPTGIITFANVNFDAKGGGALIITPGTDPTLPVELSSFNAVLTAQNYVKLNWTSESETNMLGYRVYRAESADMAEAILITPIMIQATNTSTTQHYGLEDKEVYAGSTYYYWLEAVDYSHSVMYGYSAVEVLADVAPELPVQSVMKNAYPNPFKMSNTTNIEVSVKAGETGSVTIYNVLGQVVKTYKVNEGNHTLNWNGRDNKGNLCGSGIYFYKMSTPSMNQTKKMVIVK